MPNGRGVALGLTVAASLIAANPAAAASALPADVVGTVWEWVNFITPKEKIEAGAPEHYTLQFMADGHIAVQADCNRGMGSYTITDNRIAFSPIALTMMMCPEGSLSGRFVHELARATSFFERDGGFFLELPYDSGTLSFRRKP